MSCWQLQPPIFPIKYRWFNKMNTASLLLCLKCTRAMWGISSYVYSERAGVKAGLLPLWIREELLDGNKILMVTKFVWEPRGPALTCSAKTCLKWTMRVHVNCMQTRQYILKNSVRRLGSWVESSCGGNSRVDWANKGPGFGSVSVCHSDRNLGWINYLWRKEVYFGSWLWKLTVQAGRLIESALTKLEHCIGEQVHLSHGTLGSRGTSVWSLLIKPPFHLLTKPRDYIIRLLPNNLTQCNHSTPPSNSIIRLCSNLNLLTININSLTINIRLWELNL